MRQNRWCKRVLIFGVATAIAAATLEPTGTVVADDFPSRPVTIVVPYPAGGANDVVGRILADSMRAHLGRPIIIENIVGGSGSTGIGRVARASPDGYTLSLSGWAGHVLNGAVLALQYDVVNDFKPIALIASNPLMIIARKDFPAGDLKAFIAWLQANPDKALQGTAGSGGLTSVVGAFFRQQTGTRFQSVPYRGTPLAMRDLAAAQIDFIIDLAASAAPLVKAGSVKAYAVTSKRRFSAAPDVPTVDETGLAGFHVSQWSALFAPKGTPEPIVRKLNAAVVTALADSAVKEKLAAIGQEIFPSEQQTPDALRAYQRAEIAKWWPIIRAAGLKKS